MRAYKQLVNGEYVVPNLKCYSPKRSDKVTVTKSVGEKTPDFAWTKL